MPGEAPPRRPDHSHRSFVFTVVSGIVSRLHHVLQTALSVRGHYRQPFNENSGTTQLVSKRFLKDSAEASAEGTAAAVSPQKQNSQPDSDEEMTERRIMSQPVQMNSSTPEVAQFNAQLFVIQEHSSLAGGGILPEARRKAGRTSPPVNPPVPIPSQPDSSRPRRSNQFAMSFWEAPLEADSEQAWDPHA